MTTHTENGIVEDGTEAVDASPLGRIRAKREQLAGQSGTLTLEIPGYAGDLHARYRYIPFSQAKKQGEVMRESTPKKLHDLYGCADTLILTCQEILVRGADGELEPVDLEADTPIRFEKRLADELGFEAPSARAVVLGVFNNDYGVIAQAMRVSAWLQDTTKAVDQGYVGE